MKGKFILRRKGEFLNFSIKEKLMLWISGSKRRSFSTQEVGRKWYFPSIYEACIIFSRSEKDEISVLKKENDKMIIPLVWTIMFTDY